MTFTISAWTPDGTRVQTIKGPVNPDALVHDEPDVTRRHKLNDEQRDAIRYFISIGWSDARLAREFGVSASTIRHYRLQMEK